MKIRVIGTGDLMRFKNVGIRAAQKEMERIKDYLDKEKHQLVTNLDVAEYYGIPVELWEDRTTEKTNK